MRAPHSSTPSGELPLLQELRKLNLSVSDAAPDRWGRTLLHYAASNGHSGVMAELLEAQLDPDPKDRSQSTPLHLASARGHSNVVQQLLKHNASSNATDLLQRSPLHYASMFGHVAVMRLLVDSGAVYSAEDLDGETAAAYLARTPFLH